MKISYTIKNPCFRNKKIIKPCDCFIYNDNIDRQWGLTQRQFSKYNNKKIIGPEKTICVYLFMVGVLCIFIHVHSLMFLFT